MNDTTHSQRALHRNSEGTRRQGTETNRQGTVEKVEEKDGERKALVIWGYTPDGKPCKVWAHSQEHRSGQQRSQDAVKPGQNVTLQGVNMRQATFTPQAEADHAPQPKHAPEINGRSQSIGKKLRVAYHGGQDEEDQQQQGGQSGGGSGGGQSGGQQKQKYEKEHYNASWIAKEPEEMKKYKPQDGKPQGGAKTGSQSSMSGKEQPQQQQKKEEKEERAMQTVMHEKEGFTNVIGKGSDAVRNAVHPKGSKMNAGKDNYVVAEKDKDTIVRGKQDVYLTAKDKNIYAYAQENPFVNKPWVIKEKKKDDPVPNHDLGGDSGGSGSA